MTAEMSENKLASLAGKVATRVAKKAAWTVLRWLLSVLAPVLLPAVGVLLLFFILYGALFILPKTIMEDKWTTARAKVVAIFNTGAEDTWTLDDDQRLQRQYEDLGARWQEGLETPEELRARLGPDWQEEIDSGDIVSEYEQAEPYRLPWAILAGVDRVLGDPAMTGERERRPQPEANYNELKPVFKWETVTFRKTIEEEVEETHEVVNEDGTTSTVIETHLETRHVEARVRLLVEARTYEANYGFEYEPVTRERGIPGINQQVAHVEVLKTISKQGPYFGPLTNLLASKGLTDPLDAETALQLAMTYDESYAADLSLLGTVDYGFQVDLTKQYWQGPTGTRTAPLPLEYMRNITSPFGMRIHPILATRRFHSGTDFGAPQGVPVYAFENGLIIYSGQLGAYGQAIIIDHGGIKTMYGHLSKILVQNNQEIASGQQIGEVGSTGLSTGPHLHFEVHEIGGGKEKVVDPLPYLTEE